LRGKNQEFFERFLSGQKLDNFLKMAFAWEKSAILLGKKLKFWLKLAWRVVLNIPGVS